MTAIITLTPNPAIDVSTYVDIVAPTRKLRCSSQQRDPGGGGINVARVVKRLGDDVTAVYLSGGTTGELLRQLVEREGIRSHVLAFRGETREDFTVSETSTGNQFRFVLPGPTIAEKEWPALLDTLSVIRPAPTYIVASGSLPPGIPDDFYARAARIARTIGAKFVLDTSGPALHAALVESIYLIKPNLRELTELAGRTLSDQLAWIEASRILIADGHVEIVALTLGHRGALLVTNENAWRARALSIKPVSAVGAGDSFLGGMMFRLATGATLEDAFRTAVAAGSAALLNPGTGLCRPEEVAALYPEVIIEPI
jgi:6-phosphofructokinase 2